METAIYNNNQRTIAMAKSVSFKLMSFLKYKLKFKKNTNWHCTRHVLLLADIIIQFVKLYM